MTCASFQARGRAPHELSSYVLENMHLTIYVQGRKHARVINNSLQFFNQPVQPDRSDFAQVPFDSDTKPNVTVPQSANI